MPGRSSSGSGGWRLGKHRGVFIAVRGGRNQRSRQSLGAHDQATAEAALDLLNRETRKLERGERPSVAAIITAYISDRASEVADPQRLQFAWRALAPHFASLKADMISKAACQAYARARAQQGRSMGTVHIELGMLRAAMKWAVREGWMPAAPYVWLPQKPPPKTRWLTREEAARLIAACDMPHLKLFTITALHTAARAGAVLDLTWDRVDFASGVIDLHDPALARTRKGRATVRMTPMLEAALREARAGALTDYVIEWSGQRVASVKKGFAAAARRAGLAGVSPHVLRHTAAVWMAEAGISMAMIAQFMGHADDRITQRVYARFSPSHMLDAAMAIQGAG